MNSGIALGRRHTGSSMKQRLQTLKRKRGDEKKKTKEGKQENEPQKPNGRRHSFRRKKAQTVEARAAEAERVDQAQEEPQEGARKVEGMIREEETKRRGGGDGGKGKEEQKRRTRRAQ